MGFPGEYLFIIAVLLIAVTAIFRAYKDHGGVFEYVKTDEGKNVAVGWVAFIMVGFLLVLFSPKSEAVELKYFQYAEVSHALST